MARVLWNTLLVLTGVTCFAGLMIVIAAAGLDRALAPADRLPRALVGMSLCAPFLVVFSLRTLWLRRVGVTRSFADLREAVLASVSSPPLTLYDLDWLNAYATRMSLGIPTISARPFEEALELEPAAIRATRPAWDSALEQVYQCAWQRRHQDETAAAEFARVADIAFRFLAADTHVRERTEPGPYHPDRFFVGRVSAAVFLLSGLLLIAQGIFGPVRLMLTCVLAGVLALLVAAGIFSRWRWALFYAIGSLALAQLAIIYLLGLEALPRWIPSVVYPIPVYFGLYLYRRRRWFQSV